MSPDGSRLSIRSDYFVQEYSVPTGEPLEAAFLSYPLILTPPTAPQGEGISYSADGSSLVLVSEQIPSPIFRLRCLDDDPFVQPVETLTQVCPDAADSGPIYGCACSLGNSGPVEPASPRAGLVLLGLALTRLGSSRLARSGRGAKKQGVDS